MGCTPSKSTAHAIDRRTGDRHAFESEEEEADLSELEVLSRKRKTSLAIPFRAKGPSVAQKSLEEILPAADDQISKRGKDIRPVGWGFWKTKKDRQEFIRAALIVLSGNGFRTISGYRVEMFFPRCGMELLAYRAALAVMADSDVVIYSFMGRQFGVDRKSAFQELILDVEAMLEHHLHNGNTHISRHGIGGGQRELEQQLRNRAIRRGVEEMIDPSEAAHAMNGLVEPYLFNRNHNHGGFVMGEVGIPDAAAAPSPHPTTGGAGAVPYGDWMRPHNAAAPPQRARQMWPRSMPLERQTLSNMAGLTRRESYPNHASGNIEAGSSFGAHAHDRTHSMPASRSGPSNTMPAAPPLASLSDASTGYMYLSTPASDVRQDATSASSGPSQSAALHQLFQSGPIPAMPDVPNHALGEVSDSTSISPLESARSPLVASATNVPMVEEPQPVTKTSGSTGKARTKNQLSNDKGKRSMIRNMRARPSTQMQYFGLDKLEEDAENSEEGKLFA